MVALFLPLSGNSNHAWQAGNLLGRHTQNTNTHTRTHCVPVLLLLLRITSVLAALPLSSMFLSCLARISVFHITEDKIVWFYTTKFLFLLLGGGAGDLLSHRVWTVLLLLQANAAGPVHTGRYALCLWSYVIFIYIFETQHRSLYICIYALLYLNIIF